MHEQGSTIRLHEGKEAIKHVYNDLLERIRPHEYYNVLGNIDLWMNIDEKFFSDFIYRRSKRKINVRVLLQHSELAAEHKRCERNYSEQVKLLPPDTVFDTNLVTTPQLSVMHQLTTPTSALVVENTNIARMHQQIFDMLWTTISN